MFLVVAYNFLPAVPKHSHGPSKKCMCLHLFPPLILTAETKLLISRFSLVLQTLSLGAALRLRSPRAASQFEAASSPAARVPSKKTFWTSCPTFAQTRARSRRTRPKCPRNRRPTGTSRSRPIRSESSTNSSSRYYDDCALFVTAEKVFGDTLRATKDGE